MKEPNQADETANGLWRQLGGEFPGFDVPFGDQGEAGPGGERSLALVVAYEGSDFSGWQVQPGLRTVQGELESRLSRLCDEPVRLAASGRTDAGVHAWGQTASFTTSSRLEPERMLAGLRALLPAEIYVRALGPVPVDFHARYSARAKTYDYFLRPGANAHLFLNNRLWAVKCSLDLTAVRQALAQVEGEHDLKAFTSRGSEVNGSTVRRIFTASAAVQPDGIWRIRFMGSGFLRHVVRNLVGAMVQVGGGRLQPAAVGEMLDAGRRLHPGPKAPASGLYLNRVYYNHPAPDGPAEGGK